MFLLGCEVPEYRIRVEGIPPDTAQLQVATYLQGRLASDSPSFAIGDGRNSYNFGLTLSGESERQAALSVAARRADGCLLAVGTRTGVIPYSDGSDTNLLLAVPAPAITTAACTASAPVILAVTRNQQGPLQTIQIALELQGWGFQPGAALSLHSTAEVLCAAGAACNQACLSPCTGNKMVGAGGGTCLTGCTVKTTGIDEKNSGPALVTIPLDPGLNQLQQPAYGVGMQFAQTVGLFELMGAPLQITLTNPDQTTARFEEVPPAAMGR